MCLLLPFAAAAQESTHTPCSPDILSIDAALADASAPLYRPVDGWVPVALPDDWTSRWPGHDGSVWYRVQWQRNCADPAAPIALGIDGFTMAGEVFINDDLLWRDVSMVEPLSRSWNLARWWLLPASALHAGENTLWIRVAGVAAQTPGLGGLRLGDPARISELQSRLHWRQYMVYLVTAAFTAAVGCLFLAAWCALRQEAAFGWYALMSLSWVAYLSTLLMTSPWPFPDTVSVARANLVAFTLYVLCFCRFTWAFGGQSWPRASRVLSAVTALSIPVFILTPESHFKAIAGGLFFGAVLVYFANCIQFQWHAWRTRDPQHILLALCWLSFLVVGTHDISLAFRDGRAYDTWAGLTGLVSAIIMGLLLGNRLAGNMRRITRFNAELEESVADARAELRKVIAHQHAQELQTARQQTRVQIAHDLHDGLGSNLVRSMALIEQAHQPLPNAHVLSLLKVMRDDLRQTIDLNASSEAAAPTDPTRWIAPLRHRFQRIFNEMGVESEWNAPRHWCEVHGAPGTLQCLGLMRVLEEALSNVIKHSRARHVWVTCTLPEAGTCTLSVRDDGVGFDTQAVKQAGLSVGMRSMRNRIQNLGGEFTVASGAEGTTVVATLNWSAHSHPSYEHAPNP